MARLGSRTFWRMMSRSVSFTTPRSLSFMIGICSPSENMSVLMPPSMPPMSSQCAMQQEKPTSVPWWKIGSVSVT